MTDEQKAQIQAILGPHHVFAALTEGGGAFFSDLPDLDDHKVAFIAASMIDVSRRGVKALLEAAAAGRPSVLEDITAEMIHWTVKMRNNPSAETGGATRIDYDPRAR